MCWMDKVDGRSGLGELSRMMEGRSEASKVPKVRPRRYLERLMANQ